MSKCMQRKKALLPSLNLLNNPPTLPSTQPTAQSQRALDKLNRNDLYHKMIEEVEDYAILMIDKDGFIVNWNKGAEKIKGYREQEIISRNFRIFYTKEDQESKLPEKLLEIGEKTGKAHHEGWRVRKDGTTFWGSIVITAIHDEEGEVIGFTKVTRDLTERKIAEDHQKNYTLELGKVNEDLLLTQQQLKAKIEDLDKANKDLEQFAYIASHDLQEPIRKIGAYFSMLCQLAEDKFDSKAHVFKEKIIASTNRMRSLINDLLTLSTVSESVEVVPIDLNKIMKEAIEGLEIRVQESNAVIEFGTLPVVRGVHTYLLQLFQNLLSNSLKFSAESPVIQVRSRNENGKAIISVRDNGIGIEEQYMEKIFQAFQRLHSRHQYEGTGIGLTICKKIVDSLSGEITVDSELGKGTTFTVTLPLAETGSAS